MPATSPTPSIDSNSVSISTRFNLNSWDMQDADVLFLTPDQVFFYAHSSLLLQYSSNYFGGLLVDDTVDDVDEEIDVSQPMSDWSMEPKLIPTNISSNILNVVLLALYQLPIKEFMPSNEILQAVIPTLASLGYDPCVIAYPQSELYGLLLRSAAADPFPMYAAAAQCSFETLAVAVSALTLQTPLHGVTDELAQQMGPIYLRRLFFLHLGRADALKRIVLPQPNLHPPESNSQCDSESQKGIQRAWALASAYIISQNHPGEINDVVSLLGTHIKCTECGRSLQERISRLVHDWSTVKYTI
ncbi:40S ribosomal protein S14 [Rhizoctonia solani AG-3 Rhs1AP]|uniref:40S ribosomal protein S14 n=2 Tax=Rhizoctonia solani AG-3 TaxID=1086053 RepID=A0A074RTF8_9AGAM|nr:40S ribosomal protein S14 [Rhizoctonia solani AG-3 Rhs1AP]KEP50154.1 40S ribosomal protein S14 [Rhizoctonia solani 123E]